MPSFSIQINAIASMQSGTTISLSQLYGGVWNSLSDEDRRKYGKIFFSLVACSHLYPLVVYRDAELGQAAIYQKI